MRKQYNATKNGVNEREFGAVLRARDAFKIATRGQSNSMTLHQNSRDGVIERRRTTDAKNDKLGWLCKQYDFAAFSFDRNTRRHQKMDMK